MQFELNGNTYKVGKLDATTQLHIVRRIAPAVIELFPVLGKGADKISAFKPFADILAKTTDADANYIIFGLLKVVQRQQPNGLGWGPVATAESLMYEDITWVEMLQIAYRSFNKNVYSFFPDLPSGLQEAVQKASAQ